MKKIRSFLLFFTFSAITINITSLALAQGQKKPVIIKVLKPGEWPVVTISGRLKIEARAKEERLIFHAKDGQLYIVQGKLREQLEGLLSDLGENNMVTLAGQKEDNGSLSCDIAYRVDAQGNKTRDAKCIRYYNLTVIKFSAAGKSDEELPPPKRDNEEEKKALAAALSSPANQEMMQYLTLTGTVKSLNLRSPVKTIEVRYADQQTNQPLDKTILLSPNARVVKKTPAGPQEYMDVSINALKASQEVTVLCVHDERKTEALAITITKEKE